MSSGSNIDRKVRRPWSSAPAVSNFAAAVVDQLRQEPERGSVLHRHVAGTHDAQGGLGVGADGGELADHGGHAHPRRGIRAKEDRAQVHVPVEPAESQRAFGVLGLVDDRAQAVPGDLTVAVERGLA
jgi:hypothetical protein